jgi:hypothetical protein
MRHRKRLLQFIGMAPHGDKSCRWHTDRFMHYTVYDLHTEGTERKGEDRFCKILIEQNPLRNVSF